MFVQSALLKSLAGRLTRDASCFKGEVRWNGQTHEQCTATGQQLAKVRHHAQASCSERLQLSPLAHCAYFSALFLVLLAQLCAFVEQGDVHFPMLTVRETFQFALDNSNADSALLGTPEFCAMQAKKVELMLELLGLKECADTVVGDTFLRGVSGGQKKRVRKSKSTRHIASGRERACRVLHARSLLSSLFLLLFLFPL